MANISNMYSECMNQTLQQAIEWKNMVLNKCIDEEKSNVRSSKSLKSLLREDGDENLQNNNDETEAPTEPDNDISGICEEGNISSYDYKGYFLTSNRFTYTLKDCNIDRIGKCEIQYVYDDLDYSINESIFLIIYFYTDPSVIELDSTFCNQSSKIRYYNNGKIVVKTIKEYEENDDGKIKNPFSEDKLKIIKKDKNKIEIEINGTNKEFTRYSINTNIFIYNNIDTNEVVNFSKISFDIRDIPTTKSYIDTINGDNNDYRIWGVGNDIFTLNINKQDKSVSIENEYNYHLLNNQKCGRLNNKDKNVTSIHSFEFNKNLNATINPMESAVQTSMKEANSTLYSYLIDIKQVEPADNYSDYEIQTENDKDEEEYYEGSSGYVIKKDDDDGLSGGEIAGIVIGCVAFVIIIILIIYFCSCRKEKKTHVSRGPYEDAPASIYIHTVPATDDNGNEFAPKSNKSFITIKS